MLAVLGNKEWRRRQESGGGLEEEALKSSTTLVTGHISNFSPSTASVTFLFFHPCKVSHVLCASQKAINPHLFLCLSSSDHVILCLSSPISHLTAFTAQLSPAKFSTHTHTHTDRIYANIRVCDTRSIHAGWPSVALVS